MKRIRKITDLSVFFLTYQDYIKGVCINKLMNILNHFYQSLNAFQARIQCKALPLGMVQKMKKIRDNKGVFVAVLTDPSDAFDCILHGFTHSFRMHPFL